MGGGGWALMATARFARDPANELAQAGDFRLGPAEVRPSLLQIRIGGHVQTVEPRVMQMLVVLHAAAGATLTKVQLVDECWGGLAVSDDAITQCVLKLRRALGGIVGVSVESVPRVGYRLHVADLKDAGTGRTDGLGRRPILIGAAAAVVAGAAGAGAWWQLSDSTARRGDSIAVLPFANLSSDPKQTYFSDGIAEEVRNALSRLDGVQVVGRTSSEALRSVDAQSVARRLRVAKVLTGSVRLSPTTVRVAAQLIDGRNGFEVWSRTYDLAPGDALQLQTDIATSVALALGLKLGRTTRNAIVAGGTQSAVANDLYLQAKLAFRTSDTEATYRKVIALCDAAIGLDAYYANAWALKGSAWDALASTFASDPKAMHEAYTRGADAGRKAIALAPQIAGGYVALARSMSGQLNVRGALELYRRAAPLAHTDPGIVSWWIQTLAEIGKTAEALALSQRLIALDPLNANVFGRQAFAYFFARQYDLAMKSSKMALTLAPDLTEQQSLIGDCLCLAGRYDEALAQYAKAPVLDPYRLTGEGLVAGRTGDIAAAIRAATQLARSFGDSASYQLAVIRAQSGDTDGAFAALERGREVLDPGLNGLPADPFIDPLRSDSRLAALLSQLHLP